LQTVANDSDNVGIGFTVTNKVGNAPERNRIKRRLRAAAKACNTDFKDKHDYVLIGRRDVLNASFSVLVTGLKRQIDRIHGSGPDAQKS